jgi:uncharacterized HhH-GPD family protein
MEQAFAGPLRISQRTGRDLAPAEIAEYDPEQFAAVLAKTPAVHRFPAAMAKRIQRLAEHLNSEYAGDPTRLWTEVSTAEEVLARFEALPGFGKPKARILLALLGKQFGVTPIGWREAADPYGEEGSHLSVADVTGPESLSLVRATKRERKAEKKAEKKASQRPGTKKAARAAPTSGPTLADASVDDLRMT